MSNWLLFDVETTGLKSYKDPVLSIGAILWNQETNRSSEFYRLLDWTRIPRFNLHIPEETKKIHGITINMLHNDSHSYHPAEVMSQMYQWISDNLHKDDFNLTGLVAFNSPFDINMMRSSLQYLINKYQITDEPGGGYHDDDVNLTTLDIERMNKLYAAFTKYRENGTKSSVLFIDSLSIDRIFHFEEDGIKLRHNLEDVGNRYGLDPNEHAHNAMYDTRRLFSVFVKQLEEMSEKGITIDESFETRLEKKSEREQSRFRNGGMQYYGVGVPDLNAR